MKNNKIVNLAQGFAVEIRKFNSPRVLNFIIDNRSPQGDGNFELIFSFRKRSLGLGFLYPNNKKRIPDFQFNSARALEKLIGKYNGKKV